jgi:signal transduction histidine kinase/DNA-binding NarL/FixJ family response regulator
MNASSTGPAAGRDGTFPDFQALFESVPAMLLVLEPDLTIAAVSDGYLRGTQASRDDIVGTTIWEALTTRQDDYPPGAITGLRASLERVRRDLTTDQMEVQKRYLLRAGSQGTFEVCYFQPENIPVLAPDGSLRYIIHRLEDITAQTRDLEEAHRAQAVADSTKDEFISRISHEMRNPINTILGFGELLSLGELTAEHQEWAAMLLKAARNLASFMDDVVDISRAQARELSLAIESVPVTSVITDAVDIIRPLAASHGVQVDAPPRTSQCVYADQQRLRQILLNLLSNAVKYNHPAGRVTISITCPAPASCRISIADTGRGIAGYDIERLFTPFQRLDAAQAGIEGAGLGLSLSRQLIEAMGGTVGATSTHGEGSIFWVELPIAQPAAVIPPVTSAEPLIASRAYAGPKTVLYIEDMVETLRLVEHIFKQRPSVSIVPAMLGGVALDLAAQYHPDLILLDLNLPDMPGAELLHRIKSDPGTSAIPVVIVSAETDHVRIERLLAEGATGYLTKPFSVRGFLQIIDTLLDQPGAIPPQAAGQVVVTPATVAASQATSAAAAAAGTGEVSAGAAAAGWTDAPVIPSSQEAPGTTPTDSELPAARRPGPAPQAGTVSSRTGSPRRAQLPPRPGTRAVLV